MTHFTARPTRPSSTLVRRVIGVAFLVAAVVSPAVAQEPVVRFDDYLTAIAKEGQFSGAVLVARNGQVIFRKAYGQANVELGVANEGDTVFRIGSLTKQFTAAAIMLLRERGRLSLADPICTYIDECPQQWQPITIEHLLTHTSGIPNTTTLARSAEDARRLTVTPIVPARQIDLFKPLPLDFPAGRFNDRLLTAESRTAMTTPGKGAYGYGLRIGRMHNRALVYHGGSINGFDALLMRFTDERVTIVVLRNADYGTPSEDAIGRDLAAILFGEPDEAQGR